MDAYIKNGDLVLDHRGNPVMLTGAGELAQRAALRLAARRGSLPHDPAFGSALHRLRPGASLAETEARALAAVRQALAPLPQTTVQNVTCAWDARARRMTVRAALALRGAPYELEVTP